MALMVETKQQVRGDAEALIEVEVSDTWVRDASDPIVFRRTATSTRSLHPRVVDALRRSATWQDAEAAIRSDDVLGRVADQLVGTQMGRGRVDTEGLIRSALERGLVGPDPGASIQEAVRGWKGRFAQRSVTTPVVAILDNVQIDRSVEIAPRVVLRPMTDEEVATALRVGAMPTAATFGSMAIVRSQACLVVEEDLDLVIGSITAPSPSDPLAPATHSLEAAFLSLRLAGMEQARWFSQMTLLDESSVGWGMRAVGPSVGITEQPSEHVIDQLLHFYPPVRAALGTSTVLSIALGRYNSSLDPQTDVDVLLDLWIAMEALFSPRDGSEISFRLAQTAANFVLIEGYDRLALFKWLRKSYGLRSKVVHGRPPSASALKRLDGAVGTVGEIASDLRVVVRSALIQCLDGNSPRPDESSLKP